MSGPVPPGSKAPDEGQPPPAPKPGQPVGSKPPTPPAAPKPPDSGKPQEPPQTPPGAVKPPPVPPPAAADASADKTVGEIFLEVSEQVSILVREEVELAKTEVTEKVSRLLRGSVVGLVAGVFGLLALFLIMHGVAILLGQNVFGGRVWLGYLVESILFILIAAGGGFYAYRALKKGSPPVPEMAIEQAKEIRATLESKDDGKGAK